MERTVLSDTYNRELRSNDDGTPCQKCSVGQTLKKRAQPNYTMTALNSKWKHEKLEVVIHVLQTTQNLVILRCRSEEDGKEMYKDL